jgi:hypothetical protein
VGVGDVSGVAVHPVLAIDEVTKRIYLQAAGSGGVGVEMWPLRSLTP